MRCLYCGKRLSLLRKLAGKEFCCDAHHTLYVEDQESLGLARLIEAKQTSKGSSGGHNKITESRHGEIPPPVERFVPQFPKVQVQIRPYFNVTSQILVSPSVSIPQVDLSVAPCRVAACRREVSLRHLDAPADRPDIPEPHFLGVEMGVSYPPPLGPEAPRVEDSPRPGLVAPLGPAVQAASTAGRGVDPGELLSAGAVEWPSHALSLDCELSTGGVLPEQAPPPPAKGRAAGSGVPLSFRLDVVAPSGKQELFPPARHTDSRVSRGVEEMVTGFATLRVNALGGPGFRDSEPPEAEVRDLPCAQPSLNMGVNVCLLGEAGGGGEAEWRLEPKSGNCAPRREAAAAEVSVPARVTPAGPTIEASHELSPAGLQAPAAVPFVAAGRPAASPRWAEPVAALPAALAMDAPPQECRLAPAGLWQAVRAITAAAKGPKGALPEFRPKPGFELDRLAIPSGHRPRGVSELPAAAGPRRMPFQGDCTFGGARRAPTPAPLPPPVMHIEAEYSSLSGWSGTDSSQPVTVTCQTGLLPLPVDRFAPRRGEEISKCDLAPESTGCGILMPRLRATPVKDSFASLQAEKKADTPVWQRLAAPAVAALRATPPGVRWLVMAIPLASLLFWHVASREEVASAVSVKEDAQSVLAVRWQAFQENVSSRAAVSLADDFRGGLSEWTGGKEWSKSWYYDAAGFIRPGSLALYKPSMQLADYEFEFAAVIESGGMNWVFRASDLENYYGARLSIIEPGPMPKGAIDWYAVVDGKRSRANRTVLPFDLRNEKMYRFRVTVRGTSFTTFLDDRVIDFFEDDRLSRGGVGFFQSRGDKVRLRWISVIHQYDVLGRLCALISPYSLENTPRSVSQ